MKDLTFRDIGRVRWADTIKLAGMRSLASAVVLTAVGLALGMFSSAGAAFSFFLFWTIGSAIGGVGNLYMLRAISALVSPIGGGIITTTCTLMSYFIALLLAAGDPLLYALKQQFPELVPADEFKLLNLRAVIFVLDEPMLPVEALADEDGVEADPSVA